MVTSALASILRALGMHAAGQHDRPRGALQQGADQVLFAVKRIMGVAKQHLQPGALERARHAAHGVGEVGIVERRDQRRDEAGPAGIANTRAVASGT